MLDLTVTPATPVFIRAPPDGAMNRIQVIK